MGLRFGTSNGPSTYWGVVTGDADGDGKEELIFGCWQLDIKTVAGGVRIWKQGPGGKWTEMTGTGLPVNPTVCDVAAADFDGDGILDIACGVSNNTTGNKGILLYKGTGKGKFTAWSANGGLPAAGLPRYVEGLEAGDFDGDGRPDLAAAVFGGGVIAFRNTSTGFHVFGKGCSGSLARVPRLAGGGPVKIGLPFTLKILDGPAGGTCLVGFGRSRSTLGAGLWLPLDLAPLGGPGCRLYVAPLVLKGVPLNPSGTGSMVLPVPNLPVLYRAVLYVQGLIPAKSANPLGLVTTSGGGIRVGK